MLRTHSLPWLTLIAVVLLCGVSTTRGQQFRNTSFEDSIVPAGDFLYRPTSPKVMWKGTDNWGLANGSGAWGTGGHTGQQYALLQAYESPSGTTMSQAVGGFVVGSPYVVDYWMARRNGNVGGNDGTSLTVKVDDQIVIVDKEFSAGNGVWLPYTSRAFRATGDFLLFTFSVPSPNGDRTLLLDDVMIRLLQNGDANLDGAFDSADLAAVFAVGKYEKNVEADWSDGDWDGDGRFNSTDLIAAIQTGNYERKPTAQVPEPSTGMATFLGLLAVCCHRRR